MQHNVTLIVFSVISGRSTCPWRQYVFYNPSCPEEKPRNWDRGGILADFSVESHLDSSFLLAVRMQDAVIETDFLGEELWP